MTEPLLRPREVAVMLRVGISTIYRLAGTGTLPTVRVPGTSFVRFRRERVEELLKRWEVNGRNRGRKARSGTTAMP